MGHPAKEGLRPLKTKLTKKHSVPQSGSSSKRGIKTVLKNVLNDDVDYPEWVIQQKRD